MMWTCEIVPYCSTVWVKAWDFLGEVAFTQGRGSMSWHECPSCLIPPVRGALSMGRSCVGHIQWHWLHPALPTCCPLNSHPQNCLVSGMMLGGLALGVWASGLAAGKFSGMPAVQQQRPEALVDLCWGTASLVLRGCEHRCSLLLGCRKRHIFHLSRRFPKWLTKNRPWVLPDMSAYCTTGHLPSYPPF